MTATLPPQADQPERRIYTVEQLNKAIQAALLEAFPGSVWVRGEIQRLPADAGRRKHIYFELHDTSGGGAANFQIAVALLEWDRKTFGLGRFLDGSDPDLQLRDKLEVCLECRVDFYPPFGKLSLKVVGVDKNFTLGQLEALRREVLAFLKREGLLELNAGVPLPELPLRVGLITAAGSAAERDFRTGLEVSPYRFVVELVGCRMQGEQTEAQVTAALRELAMRGVDVIVLTRGGGSRGDLSWFDQKGIAVAIATCSVPVVTAIGHEIDRSIADVVAHHACKTPTAAAEFLVAHVGAAAERLAGLAAELGELAAEALNTARERLGRAAALASPARLSLQVAARRLQERAIGLERRVGRRVSGAREELGRQRARLAVTAVGRVAVAGAEEVNRRRRLRRELAQHLASVDRRLEELAAKSRLLDPQRLLARGYTVTLDVRGRHLGSAATVRQGQRIQTRFHDGRIASIVTGGADDRSPPRPEKGEQRGGTEKGPGQGSLFS
jgi:exodeoxyribonuclease VII large subunit